MEKESYLTEINRNIKEHLDLSSRYEKLLKKGIFKSRGIDVAKISLFTAKVPI